MVIGQGTLNFFQLCVLTTQMFLEIIFLSTVPLAMKELADIGPRLQQYYSCLYFGAATFCLKHFLACLFGISYSPFNNQLKSFFLCEVSLDSLLCGKKRISHRSLLYLKHFFQYRVIYLLV